MNVLLITADQWRGDTLSGVGHACVSTPNLDRLAGDGVLFSRHYSQATPCAPGRASLYTGMYLRNHRVVTNGTPLDARHSNIALEARSLGYEPALFGYTDVSADPRTLSPGDPALYGRSTILPGMRAVVPMEDAALPWRAHLQAEGYSIPEGKLGLYASVPDVPGSEGRGGTYAPAFFRPEHSSTAFLTGEAIKYISVQAGTPWFVHLSYLSPHPPFVVPAPYHDSVDPADVPMPVRSASPELEARQHPFLAHYLYNQKGWDLFVGFSSRRNLELDDDNVRQARATYYAMMGEVDTQIGRLLDYLRETGAYQDTLIVFTSDHGEQLGDHWAWAKYCYFDETFHIPLIVRDPGAHAIASRGSKITCLTENVDVMPTIVERMGLDIPAQCDGESLMPFVRGETPHAWREEAHWEFDFRDWVDASGNPVLGLKPDQCTMSVLRGARYKYVHFTALPPLFFDLHEDPHEFRDLASDPGHAARVLEHAQKMLSWRMLHDERVLANTSLTEDGPRVYRGPRR